MLDSLYEDIGKQLKNWAKSIFVVEAVACLLGGIIFFMANENDDLTIYGFLILFLGPIVAWVSSWLLYGFGELIDKACDNEHNTREVLAIMKAMEQRQEKGIPTQSVQKVMPTNSTKPIEKATSKKDSNTDNGSISATIRDGEKICPKCGMAQKIDRTVCWSCGQRFDN